MYSFKLYLFSFLFNFPLSSSLSLFVCFPKFSLITSSFLLPFPLTISLLLLLVSLLSPLPVLFLSSPFFFPFLPCPSIFLSSCSLPFAFPFFPPSLPSHPPYHTWLFPVIIKSSGVKWVVTLVCYFFIVLISDVTHFFFLFSFFFTLSRLSSILLSGASGSLKP